MKKIYQINLLKKHGVYFTPYTSEDDDSTCNYDLESDINNSINNTSTRINPPRMKYIYNLPSKKYNCNCRKSRCNRNYCICKSNNEICGEKCACDDCMNGQ